MSKTEVTTSTKHISDRTARSLGSFQLCHTLNISTSHRTRTPPPGYSVRYNFRNLARKLSYYSGYQVRLGTTGGSSCISPGLKPGSFNSLGFKSGSFSPLDFKSGSLCSLSLNSGKFNLLGFKF